MRYISYKNIYNNLSADLHAAEKVSIDSDENQNKIDFKDILFTTSSETPNDCGISSIVSKKPTEDIYLNSFCFGFRLNTPSDFHPSYLKHLFRSSEIRKQIIKTANGVTRYNISKKLFANIKIPILPYEQQKKIGLQLDTFDNLINSLTKGLPLEIEKIEQQYKYYRNKLLSFPKFK